MFMSAALDLSTTAEEVRYKAEIEQYFMVFSERQDTLPRKLLIIMSTVLLMFSTFSVLVFSVNTFRYSLINSDHYFALG